MGNSLFWVMKFILLWQEKFCSFVCMVISVYDQIKKEDQHHACDRHKIFTFVHL